MKLFDDYLPKDGEYDMRRDTTGLPKALANKINSHICFKGGGGQPTVTKSGIDDEFKPYLEKVLKDVTGRYEKEVAAGPDSIVAAMTPEQKEALAKQKALSTSQGDEAQAMIEGTGAYDMSAARDRDLQNLMGSAAGQASTSGGLGGARFEKAMGGALADRSLQLQKDRQSQRKEGISGLETSADTLGKVGTAKQKYEQERLDAPHTSAQRYFGYLSGAPQQKETEGGGGGK
jgi:hypothetical protein